MTGPLLFLVFLAVSILGVYYVAMRGYSRAGAVQLPKRAEPVDYEHAQRLYLGYRELVAAGLADEADCPPAVLTCSVCGAHAFENDPPPARHVVLHGTSGIVGITCRHGPCARCPETELARVKRCSNPDCPIQETSREPHLRPRAEAPGREGASE